MAKEALSREVEEAAAVIERILDELEGTERELFLSMLAEELKKLNK